MVSCLVLAHLAPRGCKYSCVELQNNILNSKILYLWCKRYVSLRSACSVVSNACFYTNGPDLVLKCLQSWKIREFLHEILFTDFAS